MALFIAHILTTAVEALIFLTHLLTRY